VAWGNSQPRIVARENSQPQVVAWENSQPQVEAWENSQPRIEAWGNSQPRIVARGNSQPQVVARAYAQLSLSGHGIAATAAASVAILLDRGASATGGMQTTVRRHTPAEWCDYYDLPVSDGVVVLFKAVGDNFRSLREGNYTPGTVPVADDWDGGERECGGGLHFSPTPRHAKSFNPGAKRFVACPVALSDFVVHPEGDYPEKIKAAGCCAPVWECSITGERVLQDIV
jgi:hypothetical protein